MIKSLHEFIPLFVIFSFTHLHSHAYTPSGTKRYHKQFEEIKTNQQELRQPLFHAGIR